MPLGARTLLIGAPGIATRSKDATRGASLLGARTLLGVLISLQNLGRMDSVVPFSLLDKFQMGSYS